MTGVNFEALPIEYEVPFQWGNLYVSEAAHDAYGLPRDGHSLINTPAPATGDPLLNCYLVAPGELPAETVARNQDREPTPQGVRSTSAAQMDRRSINIAMGLSTNVALLGGRIENQILHTNERYSELLPYDEARLDKGVIAILRKEVTYATQLRIAYSMGGAATKASQQWYAQHPGLRARISLDGAAVQSLRKSDALGSRVAEDLVNFYGLGSQH